MNLDWQSILKRHPVFSALDKKEVDYLIEVSDEKEYEKDDVVIREGERANSLFVIGFGAVEVVLPWRGEQTLHLTTLTKGEFFGEVALFEKPSRRSATVIAAGRCVLLEIDGEQFLTIARKHPEIVMDVIEKVTSRLRDIGDHVLKVKLRDMDEKIQTLNTRLDAELRATDATLNATQTVFDQTSRRANEIIESAERSRTRLTTTASIIGTGITGIVAVFGYLGFSQLDTIRSHVEDIKDKKEQIDKVIKDVDIIRPKIDASITKLDAVDGEIKRFYKKIVLPEFFKELTGTNPYKAEKMYQAMLGSKDDDVIYELFGRINASLFEHVPSPETDRDETDDSDGINNDIIIIEMIKNNIGGRDNTPQQELLSYFSILLWFTISDERDRFESELDEFKDYVQDHQDLSIREDLLFDISEYESFLTNYFDEDSMEQKMKQLTRVWNQIPLR